MFKHTQTICRLLLTNCLSVFDHFMGLTLKGLTIGLKNLRKSVNQKYHQTLSLQSQYHTGKIFFDLGCLYGHWQFIGLQGSEGHHLYSSPPFPLGHRHPDIYLELCMWEEYQVFLIASLVIARLLLNEIYHLWDFIFDLLLIEDWFRFWLMML